MSNDLKSDIERVKREPEVQRALHHATPRDTVRPIPQTRDKLLLGTHAILLLALGAFYYLLTLRFFGFAARYVPLLQKLTLSAEAVVLVFAVLKLTDVYLLGGVQNPVSQYNLRRVSHLLAALIIAILVVTILFQNWYTAVVSLGLISLVLGFALQTPITSFIGWIYILVREPYRVGDRVRIGDATGDVIDVGYLDTTLWEFGGEYLSTDHPSGRVIKFPNSNVLSTPVYNYSWPLFPYLWNEIKFQVAYNSDLEFIARTMQEIAERQVGEAMMKQVRIFRELLAHTPIDQLQVQERPVVMFRVSDNTWLEAIVRYLVHPREAGRVKTKLIKELLATLNADPDRVKFPRDNMR
ncbi:MAG: mechanosensitive ion channel family protein [Pyrinomonadaceae bacterium]